MHICLGSGLILRLRGIGADRSRRGTIGNIKHGAKVQKACMSFGVAEGSGENLQHGKNKFINSSCCTTLNMLQGLDSIL